MRVPWRRELDEDAAKHGGAFLAARFIVLFRHQPKAYFDRFGEAWVIVKPRVETDLTQDLLAPGHVCFNPHLRISVIASSCDISPAL